MKTKKRPDPDELARLAKGRQAENRECLREAYRIAAIALPGSSPTIEVVLGVRDLLLSEALRGDHGLVLTHLGRALGATKRCLEPPPDLATTPSDSAIVLAVAEILLIDDDAEQHLREAQVEAANLFGANATAETAIDLYYEIYAEEDDDGDE